MWFWLLCSNNILLMSFYKLLFLICRIPRINKTVHVQICFCVNISVHTCFFCIFATFPYAYDLRLSPATCFWYVRVPTVLLSTAECGHYAIRPVARVSSSGNTTPHDPYNTALRCAEKCQWAHIIYTNTALHFSLYSKLMFQYAWSSLQHFSQIYFSRWLILHEIAHLC